MSKDWIFRTKKLILELHIKFYSNCYFAKKNLNITKLKNKPVFQFATIRSGVYLFQIVQEGKKVSDGKFIVTH